MTESSRRTLAVVVLAIGAGLAGFVLYRTLPHEAPAVRDPAPEVALPTLDGGAARLSDYRGKLVLINFWATWCAPCLKEIPLLVEMQGRYAARGLQILGPAMDDVEAVKIQAPRMGIRYPILVGQEQIPAIMEKLGDTLGALPFSVLISPDGYVVLRKHGEFSRDELTALLEKHLPIPG
ncbi:MAG TPA: TlpA disulfide reductase family protein [Nevskiaceae bacterium]|nr:TlpA disulfide reductase family protein [Nevskiaceae bacterium]